MTPGHAAGAHRIKELEERGWAQLDRGEHQPAIRTFAEVFARDPDNLAAFQGTIAAHRLERDFPAAEALLERARAVHPQAPGILGERAWLALAQKRIPEAIGAFRELLALKRDDDNLFITLLGLLRTEGRYDEADALLAEASKLFPGSEGLANERGWLAFYQRHYDEAWAAFTATLRHNRRSESALQGRIACRRLEGCYDEALKLAAEALAERPDSPGLHSERAWIHFAQAAYKKAEEDFRRALALSPREPASYINVVWAFIRQENEEAYSQAAELCRQALEIDPKLADAFGCLGIIAFKRGSVLAAEGYLKRSVRVDPRRGFHADLGALYTSMGCYDDAEAALLAAVAKNREDAYAFVELGNLHLRTGRLESAVRQYRRAAALDPRSPDAWKGLAIALTERNDLDEAESVLRQAIHRLDGPCRWSLHLQLARLLSRQADDADNERLYQEALEEVRCAIRLRPGHAEPHFQAGLVRWKLDDLAGARTSFRRCLQADPQHLAAQVNEARLRELLKDRRHSRISRAASLSLAALVLVQLVVVWVLHVWTDKVSNSMITALVPILFGLLVVAVALPWLSRLKMTGLEAELSEPQAKDTVAAGPKGAVLSGGAGGPGGH